MISNRFAAVLVACALAALGSAAPAAAASQAGKTIVAPAVTVPAVAIYCDDGTGVTAICSSSGGSGGDASAANQTSVQALAGSDATKAVAVQGITGGKAVKVDGSAVTQPISAAALPLPSGASTSANQTTLNGYVDGLEGQLPASLGTKTNSTSLAVVAPLAATETRSNVSVATSSTLVLAANSARMGCSITFDSTTTGFLGLAASVSSTSYTYPLIGSTASGYSIFTCPTNWTGPIYGIGTAATGTFRVSELTQ
jgi:hypothetical protein